MDIDSLYDVSDTSPETLVLLSGLIARSRSEEQLVYRETEIDELWRLLAIERKWASGARAAQIDKVMGVVMVVHDLIGVSAEPAAAADMLRTLAVD